MKITVWHGCTVVGKLDISDAPGPDLSLDPWNQLILQVGAPPKYPYGVCYAYKNGEFIRLH